MDSLGATPPGDGDAGTPPLETTAILLQLTLDGDRAAQNRLISRFLPILTRWAHNRLPNYARDLSETGDVVQTTLLKALGRIDHFEYRREGSFMAWLRQIFINEVRDEIRRAGRNPWKVEVPPDLSSPTPTPLADLIAQETFAVYEAALTNLRTRNREAVILRLEFGYSYAEIAEAVQVTSANAARMLVSRAVEQLGKEMSAARDG